MFGVDAITGIWQQMLVVNPVSKAAKYVRYIKQRYKTPNSLIKLTSLFTGGLVGATFCTLNQTLHTYIVTLLLDAMPFSAGFAPYLVAVVGCWMGAALFFTLSKEAYRKINQLNGKHTNTAYHFEDKVDHLISIELLIQFALEMEYVNQHVAGNSKKKQSAKNMTQKEIDTRLKSVSVKKLHDYLEKKLDHCEKKCAPAQKSNRLISFFQRAQNPQFSKDKTEIKQIKQVLQYILLLNAKTIELGNDPGLSITNTGVQCIKFKGVSQRKQRNNLKKLYTYLVGRIDKNRVTNRHKHGFYKELYHQAAIKGQIEDILVHLEKEELKRNYKDFYFESVGEEKRTFLLQALKKKKERLKSENSSSKTSKSKNAKF